jgi:cyclic pyranopterin phosphate synthase
MIKLSHLDQSGAARMVDVSEKAITAREASAEAIILLAPETFAEVTAGQMPKGDVFAAARIAGIMAAKKTSELIPLCHQIPLTDAAIRFDSLSDRSAIKITATVRTVAQTGVEMEALTAASIAALTIYDMVKAMDRGVVIESVRLVSKSGGKSGEFRALAQAGPRPRTKPGKPPATMLTHEAVSLGPRADVNAEREALRSFMADRRLRGTEWAKQAGVPASQIYAYLTGRSRALPDDTIQKLANASHARVEEMFAGKPK